MEKKNNNIKEEKEKEKNPKNNIQNEKEIKEIKNSENEIKIKKPIISKEEYDNAIKKRNLMAKNSKYRPIKLLFGKHKKPLNLSNSVSVTNPTINNTNIQINNYMTYLTTVESIAEEKYMKDGKTLIVEKSPCYSIKKLNYKFQNEQLNKIMIIYIKKINETEDIYNFTNQYLSFIIKLFEDLSKAYEGEELQQEDFTGFDVALEEADNLASDKLEVAKKYYQEVLKDIDGDYVLKKDLKTEKVSKLKFSFNFS